LIRDKKFFAPLGPDHICAYDLVKSFAYFAEPQQIVFITIIEYY